MIDAVQSHKPDQDKIDSNYEVQQPRHNQDQDARDEGNDRRNVCGRKGHDDLLGGGIISDWLRWQKIEIMIKAGTSQKMQHHREKHHQDCRYNQKRHLSLSRTIV
jgi:hypothetical protein